MNKNSAQLKYEKLVSIIMPAYNSEKYIEESVQSVINQSYQNWELLIIDDYSTDETFSIAQSLANQDKRIKLYQLRKNSGAAIARNKGIKKANGSYLAFLDSDDLWKKNKLENQIRFMEDNEYTFSCTAYEFIDAENRKTGKVVTPLTESDYNGVLKYSPGNSTVVYDVDKLGKFFVPDIKRRNDFVMWLQVIKKAKKIYGISEALTQYRVHAESLSVNKKKLVKYQWRVYREIENLSFIYSLYLICHKTWTVLRNKKGNN